MEELMQWVWAHRLWPRTAMRTTDGRRLLVVNPGSLNRDAGPDFFNASVRIADQQWAGDVEMHVRASDWHRHGHDGDRAYDSVILHVVSRDDDVIRRSDGEVIAQLLMPCAMDFRERYEAFVAVSPTTLPCGREVGTLEGIMLTDVLSAMALERLQEKADRVAQRLQRAHGSWLEAVYVMLARALGFGTNSDPFERTAMATPLHILLKHRDNPLSVEAMLFGQAGLLPDKPLDDYQRLLCQEYDFMKAKFGLRPVSDAGWKMSRMRPQNSPQRRMALLAAMVSDGLEVASRIVHMRSLDEADGVFDMPLRGYWAMHYNFASWCPQRREESPLSKASRHSLLINVAAPVMYAYAVATGDYVLEDLAMGVWEHLPAEDNCVTQYFKQGGIVCRNASQSQALLQLKARYCDPRRCIYCRLGRRLLSQKIMA